MSTPPLFLQEKVPQGLGFRIRMSFFDKKAEWKKHLCGWQAWSLGNHPKQVKERWALGREASLIHFLSPRPPGKVVLDVTSYAGPLQM